MSLANPTEKEKAWLNAYVDNWLKRLENGRRAARDRAFPSHVGCGGCEELDVEYFDAMMVSVTVQCTCGDRLTIDRDFFEDVS